MNEQTTIQRAHAGDEAWLLPLIEAFYALEGYPFDEVKLRRILEPLLVGDDYGVVWKVTAPAQGYAVVTWSYSLESGGAEALIDEIYLAKRGEGLGKLLLAHILEDCRHRGIQRIFLETERGKARVRRFYQRNGFEEDDSIWLSLTL